MGYADEVESGSWGRSRRSRGSVSAFPLECLDAGPSTDMPKEPSFETFEQKKAWRRRLRKAHKEHPLLIAEVRRARRAGSTWPDGWSEAKKAQYLAGPWKHACNEQDAADAKVLARRSAEIKVLDHEVFLIGDQIRTQMVGTRDEILDAIEFATESRRMRLRELRSRDWRSLL